MRKLIVTVNNELLAKSTAAHLIYMGVAFCARVDSGRFPDAQRSYVFKTNADAKYDSIEDVALAFPIQCADVKKRIENDLSGALNSIHEQYLADCAAPDEDDDGENSDEDEDEEETTTREICERCGGAGCVSEVAGCSECHGRGYIERSLNAETVR